MMRVDVDLRTLLAPVTDQGQYSTCLAHAVTAVHEHRIGMPGQLSPEGLYFFATSAGWKAGTSSVEIRKALLSPGQPLRKHCPNTPPADAPGLGPHHKHRPDELSHRFQGIRSALLAGRFVVMGMSITHAFRTGHPFPLVEPGGSPIVAYHAVVAVGAGEVGDEPCLLIRNSWGDSWGENGHAWLAKSYIDHHLEFSIELTEAT